MIPSVARNRLLTNSAVLEVPAPSAAAARNRRRRDRTRKLSTGKTTNMINRVVSLGAVRYGSRYARTRAYKLRFDWRPSARTDRGARGSDDPADSRVPFWPRWDVDA